MKASFSPGLGIAALLLLAIFGWQRAVASELVMYTQTSCPFCLRFEREIGPIYDKTREGRRAPLRRVELRAGGVRSPELREPVIATPTFVLLDDGREVGRIIGYMNDDMFWGLLGRLVDGIERAPAATQQLEAEIP